jgi:hypothetical protein
LYLEIFRHQINRECKFALIAVEQMESALEVVKQAENEKDDQGFWNLPKRDEGVWQFWYAIEAFLRATGNLSKIFWPPRALDEKLRPMTKKRGEQLRRILEVSNDSPLKNRTLRDHFEHYDERIDEWYAAGRGDVIDSNLYPRQSLAKRKGYFRNFDPEEWVLFFVGDELALKPMIEFVKTLQQKVSQPLLDRGQVTD